ncbi:MAG: nicotinate phosphoribosyltransferase [Treponema sp.]|jgi:nicotinate phosphoribosyltransferase|nr:nicotinate phosphoribosyltransferase [Treponema sp.]
MDTALFTDLYSLTMAQGYWKNRMNSRAVFEMSFRRHPFGGGFSVFAGLETLIETLRNFSFSAEDLAYLDSLHLFQEPFLEYLKHFRFSGTLWAMDEGTIVFPQEPLVRVDGNLIESQIIEGLVLNIINFQSLVATKTARVVLAAGKSGVMEFGLRRAQGADGALSASRAAFIGGAAGTSNVLAGKVYGIPVMGTMAHSWVMSFPSEADAFRAYAALYPDRTTFLIDTYDTLKSGIHSAVAAGKELAAAGNNFGVRLDSGDIHYLSVEVRRILDGAGLEKATITVSNDLDEHIIDTLTKAGAPVDTWGVGTQMVTGGGDGAFTGVYKLTARDGGGGTLVPVIKFSDNPEKTTTPAVKQVWRIRDEKGMAVTDVMALDAEVPQETVSASAGPDIPEQGRRYAFWHPQADYRHFFQTIQSSGALLRKRLEDGRVLGDGPSLPAIQRRVREGLESFDQSYRRLLNPHIYKVSVTERLRALKLDLIQSRLGDL